MSDDADHDATLARQALLSPTLRASTSGLSFAGSRALLYSHVAIDMLRLQLIQQFGEDLARSIVARGGREAGFNDGQRLLWDRQHEPVQAVLEMQYELLTASGFGRFEVQAMHHDLDQEQVYIHVRCMGSPEAAGHVQLFGRSEVPACWHLVGYSTGWVTAMTGLPLLSVESRCVAKGDAWCEIETLPHDDFVGPEAGFWKRVFDNTSASVTRELASELASKRATIREQEQEIQQLSAPILQVTDQILVVPIIGRVDRARVEATIEKLLAAVVERSARGIILDVTGLDGPKDGPGGGIESIVQLSRLVRAVKLLGSQLVMTSLSPALAQLLVDSDVDISGLRTLRSLQDGIRELERGIDGGRR